jgi:hypothetical protein
MFHTADENFAALTAKIAGGNAFVRLPRPHGRRNCAADLAGQRSVISDQIENQFFWLLITGH